MTLKHLLLASVVSQCIAAAAATSADDTKPELAEGWRELFNGEDFSGWVIEGTKEFNKDGDKQPVWSVRDGLIHCEANKGFGFLRYDQEFCDFVLRVEYRVSKRCNSGIGIRHAKYNGKAASRPSFSGYEIQILDDGGKKPTPGSTGSLYRYVAPKLIPAKMAGEWNVIEVECRGPRIKITLNGEVVQDVDQSAIEEIKSKPLCGFVSMQNHGKTIDFRSIRLKDLDGN